jgi:hypothetical protein
VATKYVEGKDVQVERVAGAVHLRVTLRDDRCVMSAMVRRVFPLSDPSKFLSIQDRDGKEVAILRDVENLEPASRELIDAELDRRYFTPSIERITALKQDAGMWKFGVETQRGPAEFYVRNWRDNAHELTIGRWIILSVDGVRFEIPNLEAMDARSQRFMDQLL